MESDSRVMWPNSSLNFTDSERAEFECVYIGEMSKMKLFALSWPAYYKANAFLMLKTMNPR